MRILISGATGFIGTALVHRLINRWHEITVLSRDAARARRHFENRVEAVSTLEVLDAETPFDAIINLAGENLVAGRWSARQKSRILSSRLEVTEKLGAFTQQLCEPPKAWINASAIGCYGTHPERVFVEHDPPAGDFPAQVCTRWEEQARASCPDETRLTLLRIGLVLGGTGGMLSRLLPLYRAGLGGRLGHGQQWLSWIHIYDLVAIFEHLLSNDGLFGPVNACAPNPVSNAEFTEALTQAVGRKARFHLPGWLLRLTMGEMSELLLNGQCVLPQVLNQTGFRYQFPALDGALAEICTVSPSIPIVRYRR